MDNNSETINLQFTTIKSPLPNFIYHGLQSYSEDANSYHAQPLELREKISKLYNIPVDYIGLTAGNDEGIKMLAVQYGEHAHIFTPTYIGYDDVQKLGGTLQTINALQDDYYKITPETYPDASLIFIANPNNPCGVTSKEVVIEIAKKNPNAIVVVDEAYGEYLNFTLIDQVVNYENLAVLRSFSKSYGMAGNRIGYLIANPKIIKHVLLELDTEYANVSYLSVGAASIALDHQEYFQSLRDQILSTKQHMTEELKNLGYTVIDSYINSILIKFPDTQSANKINEYLKENKILVNLGNGLSTVGLDNTYIRIAIGTEQQMEKLLGTIINYKN